MTTKVCTICKQALPLSTFHGPYQKKHYTQYSARCKPCDKQYSIDLSRTIPGLVSSIFSAQKYCSKARNHVPPNYTKKELKHWITSQSSFLNLYNNWVANDYDRWLRPSCDRIDEYLPYTLQNLQLVHFHENEIRGYVNRKKGINNKINTEVTQLTLAGIKIATFYSQAEAARQTGVPQANISTVCKGNSTRASAGGFKWEYANG